MANSLNASDEKLRQLQGMNIAFGELKTLSERLVTELEGRENKNTG